MKTRTFLEILLLILIAAKLFGCITWSWWWVASPFYIGAIIGLINGIIVVKQKKALLKIQNDKLRTTS